MFGREERERAVELYFTTSMSTKQVVEHLGYPTGQCLERWLHADPRYADAVAKPPVPLGARCRAVELCLSGMQRKQVATELGAGTGAVHHWMRLYRAGGMAALGTGTSEKVIRGIMREDGLVARVPGRRRYSSYGGARSRPRRTTSSTGVSPLPRRT
ncbi:helix-turn-helix domain-containing protein [uncultured Bifidobacterium sp.]|uniref:helix-turn-helix domain-containing protein n=1 Tax=uncultured Bifidobacterium sp. TaxID=165187 RepID=UPI0027DBFBE5|nr:helix-turn-helix domain-containing protein [uncultured Bifidobacterium sp.]